MNNKYNLLITVDAGHGGYDNGASYEGRLEKNDNLALALEVQKQLLAQGVNVQMTRDTDVFVTLQDRAAMANEAGSDLFISLHRNSYIEQTPYTNGVENFIYLTASAETAGRAAQYVLDQVVNVGVQSNRGVNRGDYYVLRRTVMPAMLLEMGYIINEIDNQLFDEHLIAYAAAIARGAMQYFGLDFQDIPGVTPTPPPTLPPSPEGPEEPGICMCPCPCPEQEPKPQPDAELIAVQRQVNERFGLNMPLSGVYDTETKRAMTMALQMALNSDFNAGLIVDGSLGPKTLAAFPSVRQGQRGNVVFIIQALVRLNGYNPGVLDGIFGSGTHTAVQIFQRDHFITPDGVVGRETISALLGYEVFSFSAI